MAQTTFATTDTLPQARVKLNDNITDLGTQLATKLTSASELSADQLTSGTVPAEQLGSGTADETTFLRGDNTWAPAGAAPFSDATAIIKGSADETKLLRIEVDGFTTATTRVLTAPNFNGTIATLAGAETFSNKTFSGTTAMSQVDIASSIEVAPGADINFEDDTSALNMGGAPIVGAGVTTVSELRVGANKVLGAQGAAIADVAAADATDLATAITLVNELKTKFNTSLARDRAHGLIAT